MQRDGNGTWRIALVHRPRREDWSLPKGKLEPDETPEAGALREVLEETGLECKLDRFVGYTSYVDRRGRPKIVTYWVMEVVAEGPFAPGAEVDELRWVRLDEAVELLTYGRDRDLVASLDEFPLVVAAS
jgi:8-oxo-dGTP pyrophosphatase MutT (NUDIX family)